MATSTAPPAPVLLLAALMVTAVGVALSVPASASEDPAPQGTLEFPEPAPGDHGSYWVTHVNVDGQGHPVDTTSPRLLTVFEWLSPEPILTQAGTWISADRVMEKQSPSPHENQMTVQIRSLNAETGAILILEQAQLNFWHDQPDDLRAQQTDVSHRDSDGISSDQPFCGLANNAQGETIPLDEPVMLFEHCRLLTETWEVPTFYREPFQHAGALDLSDHTIHVFEASYDGAAVQVWFAEDIPYPVRIVHPLIQGPSGNPEIASKTLQVIDLHGFQPGSASDARAAVQDKPSLSAPAFADRTPWMLNDDGITHPFPASDAFQVALDHEDGELAAFMDDHPDAYARTIKPAVSVEEDEIHHRWQLELTDAESTLTVQVSQTIREHQDNDDDAPSADVAALLGGDAQGTDARVTHQVSVHGPSPAPAAYPAPESLPGQLPTVASMLDAWSVVIGQEPDMEHVGWELSIVGERSDHDCGTTAAPPCPEGPGVRIQLGETRDNGHETRMVVFDHRGLPVGMTAREELGSPADYPAWYEFSAEADQMAASGDAPGPFVDGFEHLPAPRRGSNLVATVIGALGFVGVASHVVRWAGPDP